MNDVMRYVLFLGEACAPQRQGLVQDASDGFEGGISAALWERVDGGGLGMGCGSLLPLAHGKNLYFSECGIRQAITVEMDTSHVT